jgi:predicted aspartyl protease
MRVDLVLKTLLSPELERKVTGIEVIRLFASVQFKNPTDWSKAYRAIVDTGAPISLLPAFVWKKLDRVELADHHVGGVGGARLPVKVAKVTCFLEDGRNRTKEMEIHAFLAQTDDVPLILGFKDLLARLVLHCDYRRQIAFVEE